MILSGDKQLEELKRFCQNEHSHYGKDEVIEKQVPTSCNKDKGDDVSNKNLNDLKKTSLKPYVPPLPFPYEWLRLNLTNNLGSF